MKCFYPSALDRPFVDSSEIIRDIKEDIRNFGEESKCLVFYRQAENNAIIFTDYELDEKKGTFPFDEIEAGEAVVVGTLKEALEAFEVQNWDRSVR